VAIDITAVKEWSGTIAAFVNVAVIGMLLKIMNEVRVTYSIRLDAIRDQNAVIQERLNLAEDEKTRLEKINTDLQKIGATLGIEEFKKEASSSVSVRDIGDNFSGKIAGRDIVDTINKRIGQLVESGNKEFKEYVDKSTKQIAATVESPFSHDYRIEFMFERGSDRMQTSFRKIVSEYAKRGWTFHGITSDYNGTDGAILVFRRPRQNVS
jgi:hypothetical protein